MTRKKPAPIPDAAGLRAAALHYLARYAASSGNLRRVLRARIDRAARQHPELHGDAERLNALRQEADNIVAMCLREQYLDDDAYAAMKARRGRIQGKSSAALAARLQSQGLTRTQISGALAAADGDDAQAEYKAALLLARRKRLGRFRAQPADAAVQRRRDLAVLARAGFSRAVAHRALRDEDDEMSGM